MGLCATTMRQNERCQRTIDWWRLKRSDDWGEGEGRRHASGCEATMSDSSHTALSCVRRDGRADVSSSIFDHFRRRGEAAEMTREGRGEREWERPHMKQ